MACPIVTLTTDFGLKDPYVAEMKAVILSISPSATIVDVTHQIGKFDIRTGAYVLASAVPYFPRGSIHIAVVDPSVGTKRQPIIVQEKHGYLVGPDNGVLALAARDEDIMHIHKIANQKLMLSKVSNTFHGRDIFAPAAAYLTRGVLPAEFGPEIKAIVRPEFTKIVRRKGMLVGEVIHVDDFGNVITNFAKGELESIESKHTINIKLKKTRLRLKLCKAYADVHEQRPLALIGSHNFLEISINQGNAAEVFKIKSGDKVVLSHS